MAAKRKNPVIVIALVMLLAIVTAVPVAATIPAVDIVAGDLELVATSPLLAPAELSISLPPPGHVPPALALEDASDHHFRIALAIAFARVEAKNRIRGRAVVGSIQLFGNMKFRCGIAPGVRNGPSTYIGFGNSPLNYRDPMGLNKEGYYSSTAPSTRYTPERGGQVRPLTNEYLIGATIDQPGLIVDGVKGAVGTAFYFTYHPGEAFMALGAFDVKRWLGDLPSNIKAAFSDPRTLGQMTGGAVLGVGARHMGSRVLSRAPDLAVGSLLTGKTSWGVVLLEGTGPDMRKRLLDTVTGPTLQGNRIVAAVQDGDIGINILGDSMFERAFYQLRKDSSELPIAFAYAEQIYLKKSSRDLASDLIHEGTHALDYLARYRGTLRQLERRANYFERQYRAARGRLGHRDDPRMLQILLEYYGDSEPWTWPER